MHKYWANSATCPYLRPRPCERRIMLDLARHCAFALTFVRQHSMTDFSALKEGLSGTAGITVGEEHTAPRIGRRRVHVLATPVMINMMEAAALDAIENLLPAGHQSLGTLL